MEPSLDSYIEVLLGYCRFTETPNTHSRSSTSELENVTISFALLTESGSRRRKTRGIEGTLSRDKTRLSKI